MGKPCRGNFFKTCQVSSDITTISQIRLISGRGKFQPVIYFEVKAPQMCRNITYFVYPFQYYYKTFTSTFL